MRSVCKLCSLALIGLPGCLLRFPVVYFQVNSIDWWGRHRVVGYGHFTVPDKPGCHEIVVSTWRPTGSLRAQVSRYNCGQLLTRTQLCIVQVLRRRSAFASRHHARWPSLSTTRGEYCRMWRDNLSLTVIRTGRTPVPLQVLGRELPRSRIGTGG